MKNYHDMNRRSFLKKSTLGTVGAMSIPTIIGGCSNSAREEETLCEVAVPEILDKAPDGRPLKAGLIGCGGRGTGAACNFLDSGNDLQITAIGDTFKDKLDVCREALKGRGQQIADENCFVGFDAYRKVIDSDVDLILHCTPAIFRPLHCEYAVSKGKHCFVEKPCAVDPVGARKMLAVGKQAAQQNLSVMSGFIRRWQKDCVETYRRVAGGAIGQIVSAHVSRMGSAVWFRQREKEWSDAEYMIRNWINFICMDGDLLVDNLIHEIDMMSWFMGNKRPERAEGTGGRHRAVIGDMYDFWSAEYLFEKGFRAHCTNRYINGCDNQNIVMLYGTKGYVDIYKGKIHDLDGEVTLIKAIRTNQPFNDMELHVQSTLMGIMAREAAYTGKFVTWDQIMASDQKLGPETWQLGPIPGFHENIPLPGTPHKG